MSSNPSATTAHAGNAGELVAPRLSRGPSSGDVPGEIAPDKILQLGLGFWGSKTLLSAVELGVFTQLARGAAKRGIAAHPVESAPARRQ